MIEFRQISSCFLGRNTSVRVPISQSLKSKPTVLEHPLTSDVLNRTFVGDVRPSHWWKQHQDPLSVRRSSHVPIQNPRPGWAHHWALHRWLQLVHGLVRPGAVRPFTDVVQVQGTSNGKHIWKRLFDVLNIGYPWNFLGFPYWKNEGLRFFNFMIMVKIVFEGLMGLKGWIAMRS